MDAIEMLARMWIECDPNRCVPGFDPDELSPLTVDGKQEMRPRWEWFVPRAEATLKYLEDNGYRLAKN